MRLEFHDVDGRKLGQIRLAAGRLVFDDFTADMIEFVTPDVDGFTAIDPAREPEKFLLALPRHFRTPYCVPRVVISSEDSLSLGPMGR